MKTLLAILVFFPLAGGVFHALFGRRVARRTVEIVACACILTSFLAASAAMIVGGRTGTTVTFFTWFSVDNFSAAMDVFYDPLAAVMALMVTFVSGLIHVYSVAYMRDEEDYARYFCYLNLFVFSMLVIVLADNLVFLFLGWEGVGFCSYALIGFWYRDAVNAAAGRKAFLLTRIGDVAFGIAIGVCFSVFGGVSISAVNANAATATAGVATLLGLLLLWSAVGKSAQLPLAVWLPDAMAGPTPVSALIHAATMVTAGVYLLMRLFPVVSLSKTALLAIACVGTVTAFYAACCALAQRDIKRLLAYSTISQVGYMFLAVGAGDIVGGMSLLLFHAFFKALLFLAAGCIIQALHEEHDIFRMGRAVRLHLPAVFWLTLAGVLALGAVPPTSGFVGKDRILLATLAMPGTAYQVLWALGTLTAFLTALYSFRLFFTTFTGGRGPEAAAPAPIPPLMVWVLWPLAILSLFAGFLNLSPLLGGREWIAHYLAAVPGSIASPDVSAKTEWTITVADGLIALGGLVLAFILYNPKDLVGLRRPDREESPLHEFVFSGFHLDRLYHAAFVRPYREVARVLWTQFDEAGIDRGLIASAGAFPSLSLGLRQWTTGRLSTYLRMFLVGLAAILAALVTGVFRG